MKRFLSACMMLALASTTAFTQNVCGFAQVAAPQVGPDYVYVTGVLCGSREAAIGAAHHWIDPKKRLTLGESAQYANYLRGEKTCFMAQDVIARKIWQKVNTDQDDNKFSVTLWEMKTEENTFMVVSAVPLKGC